MCGINGLIYKDNFPPIEEIAQMNSSIIHRGPDDDGILTLEEYENTKSILIEKAGGKIKNEPKIIKLSYKVNIGKSNNNTYEKAELIFKDYRIYVYRPGGIFIKRISDDKKLVRIIDQMKIKYYNDGSNIVNITKTTIERPSLEEALSETAEALKEEFNVYKDIVTKPKKTFQTLKDKLKKAVKQPSELLTTFGIKRKVKFDPEAIKLEIFIDGVKLLHWEGRYVKNYRAFFYQVLTSDWTPFHFYIDLPARNSIALNMTKFNKKIDKAVRKAKKRIAAEFDVTEEEIDRIIEEQIGRETEEAIDEAVKEEVQVAVQQAVAESLGTAISESFISAIEAATGEAIDQALEAELAAAIDAEIARAVEMGIEEAAVAAGWQAYFDVLAAGGTEAQAVDAAYDACGAACQ